MVDEVVAVLVGDVCFDNVSVMGGGTVGVIGDAMQCEI